MRAIISELHRIPLKILKYNEMKIIIPVVDNFLGRYTVSPSFMQTDFICFYDSEKQSFEWMATKEISQKAGNLSLALKQRGVSGTICTHMSLMALSLFVESGFTVFKGKGTDVKENIEAFVNRELEPYTARDSFASDACSGSCRSCGSTCN
jgi:predicted Fe-Mo cluster-binding NifX family protein